MYGIAGETSPSTCAPVDVSDVGIGMNNLWARTSDPYHRG